MIEVKIKDVFKASPFTPFTPIENLTYFKLSGSPIRVSIEAHLLATTL